MPFPLRIGVLMLKMTSKTLSQKLGKLTLFVVMMKEPDRLDVHCRCFLHFYFRKMTKLAKIYNRWLTFPSAGTRFARWTNSVSCLTFFRPILVARPTLHASRASNSGISQFALVQKVTKHTTLDDSTKNLCPKLEKQAPLPIMPLNRHILTESRTMHSEREVPL